MKSVKGQKEENKEISSEADNTNTPEKEITWEVLRSKCRKLDIIWKAVWIFLMIISVVYLYLVFAKNILCDGYAGRIIVSGILVVLIFVWVYIMPYVLGTERLYRECSKKFKADVIEPIFKDSFCEVTYRGFDKSQLKEIKDSGLLKKARSAIATDSVRGTYQGVDFVRYDIELSTKDKKSARIESVWITCEMRTKLKEDMQIISNDLKIGKTGYPQPEGFLKMLVGEEDFDKKFGVYIKDEKDGRDLLTNSFQKELCKLRKDNPFILGFEKSRVNVIICRKKDSLEIPLYGKIDLQDYQKEAHTEVEVVQNIIDLLKNAL